LSGAQVISISQVPRFSLTVTVGGEGSPDKRVHPPSHRRRHEVLASPM
jgi:hypothetical protein